MKKVMIWFFLSCKRYLKQPAFLAILLFLPVMAFGAAKLQEDKPQRIRIAVCAEDMEPGLRAVENAQEPGNTLELQLVGALTGDIQDDGMFEFYQCSDEEQVKDEVASRRAECGYIISANLREQLDNGHFKRVIRVYSAPSTVAASLSTETVFAALMELYDRELLKEYVSSGEAFAGLGETGSGVRTEAASQAGELYDKWKENGSTFEFRYVYGSDDVNAAEVGENCDTGRFESALLFPIRGIVAVSLFAVGLYSAVMLGTDEKKGLFKSLDYVISRFVRLAVFLAPVVLTAVSGLLALQMWRLAGRAGMLREVLAMIVYGILVTVFTLMLKKLCPNPQFLCCLIPFFIVGSLVFCPVFVDAGRIFPEVDVVGKMFLPYYYLRWFG